MNTRISSCFISSLSTSSFRKTRHVDARGLAYCQRREIMTLSRLYANPICSCRGIEPHGRVRTMTDKKI